MVLALHQRLWLGFDCFYLATMRGRDVMRYKPSLMCTFLFKKKRNQSYESVIDYAVSLLRSISLASVTHKENVGRAQESMRG